MWGEDDKELQRRKAAAFLELLIVEQGYILEFKKLLTDVMEQKVQGQEAADRLYAMTSKRHSLAMSKRNELYRFMWQWSGGALDKSYEGWMVGLAHKNKETSNVES